MLMNRYLKPLGVGAIVAAIIVGLSWTIGLLMEVANGGRPLSEAVVGAAQVSGFGIALGCVVSIVLIVVASVRAKR